MTFGGEATEIDLASAFIVLALLPSFPVAHEALSMQPLAKLKLLQGLESTVQMGVRAMALPPNVSL
jgi:hypothetical protein